MKAEGRMTDQDQSTETYRLVAYGTVAQLDFKNLPAQLESKDSRIHRPEGCVIYELGYTQKVFVFPFGTIVFFNVEDGYHKDYLKRLGITVSSDPFAKDYSKDDFVIRIEHNTLDVEIDFAILPDLELRKLLLIALLLAQSTALQLIEWQVERFLTESENMTKFLGRTGFVRRGRRHLLQFIGNGLSSRHKIVRQMSMLTRPDVTWESDELYELYDQMTKIDIFDVEQRIANVDKMLDVSGDVTDLLLEVNHTRRSEILEVIVILLITIEVVKAFFD